MIQLTIFWDVMPNSLISQWIPTIWTNTCRDK